LWNTSLLNILNKVNKGREAQIVLPNGGITLFAGRKRPLGILLHEAISENQNKSLKKRFYRLEGGDGGRDPIQIAVQIKGAMAPGVVPDKGGVPILGGRRGSQLLLIGGAVTKVAGYPNNAASVRLKEGNARSEVVSDGAKE
jgi:hypothetical protein